MLDRPLGPVELASRRPGRAEPSGRARPGRDARRLAETAGDDRAGTAPGRRPRRGHAALDRPRPGMRDRLAGVGVGTRPRDDPGPARSGQRTSFGPLVGVDRRASEPLAGRSGDRRARPRDVASVAADAVDGEAALGVGGRPGRGQAGERARADRSPRASMVVERTSLSESRARRPIATRQLTPAAGRPLMSNSRPWMTCSGRRRSRRRAARRRG